MARGNTQTLLWKRASGLGVGFDLDQLGESGFYDVREPSNGPAGGGRFFVLNVSNSEESPETRIVLQIAWDADDGTEHYRSSLNGSWTAWGQRAGGSGYSDEQAQDAVGSILADSDTIDFVYDDVTPVIGAIVKDSSITYAKMQEVSATQRLLGRKTAGAGEVEEVTIEEALAWASVSAYTAPVVPGGRLTLQSGVPLMTSTVAGATNIYYTPDRHRFCPIYDGTGFTNVDFSGEAVQATTDTTKSPAACVAEACYDLFAWMDNGTFRVTRGPVYNRAATITVTIATPAVVSWTGHGLREGAPVIFTTTGALPTGITAGTIYYVGRSPGANSFNIATSVANAATGTFVATSGSQSGTHTGTNRDTTRGTGAGTSELTTALGVPVNAQSITNGPAAQRGTYLGTIRTNGSSQVDWIVPSAPAAGGTEAVLAVWNAYNKRDVAVTVQTSSDNWTSSDANLHRLQESSGMRISFVTGLAEDAISATVMGFVGQSSTQYGAVGMGYNATNSAWVQSLRHPAVTQVTCAVGIYGSGRGFVSAGYGYLQMIETAVGGGTLTFYGDNTDPVRQQTGISATLRM